MFSILKRNLRHHIHATDEGKNQKPKGKAFYIGLAFVELGKEDATVIVEPKTEIFLHHRGILTGRTLTVMKDHRMFVKIMNLKDCPQQILKEEPIELRLPIDLISDRPKKEEGVDNYISDLQDRLKLRDDYGLEFRLLF
ncbi:hypothetical protein NQ315_012441 [Exocentrus adspersus]|uniref:Uncharacterized protein n=1 Tax=Exocentrus adspersus TaxID=1586481 RepID=A0AAV8VMG3_9CUCU|nr:hypothetical protein NQ315_012441 [Exocentrus adspersus]